MSDSQDSNIQSGNRELTDFPKMVFGVMGSAGGDVPESAREKIYVLGAEVGRRGYTLVTRARWANLRSHTTKRN